MPTLNPTPKRMTPEQAYQKQLQQAQQCVDILATIAMSIDVGNPGQYDCLGAVQDFKAGLDRLKNPKPETLPNPFASIV